MSAAMPGRGAPVGDYIAWLDARIEDVIDHGGTPLTTDDLKELASRAAVTDGSPTAGAIFYSGKGFV